MRMHVLAIALTSGCATAKGLLGEVRNPDDTGTDTAPDCPPQTWYADRDGDGFGDPGDTVESCDPVPGYVDRAGDCDDDSPDSAPAPAGDGCDAVDNDCDGTVDEDVKAGWLLLTVDAANGRVLEIDPATGEATTLSQLSGSWRGSLNSMDVRPDDALSIAHSNAGLLYTLDACTGAVREIGSTGVGDIGGISFGPDGRLYGLGQAGDTLYTLDPETGRATAVGSLGTDIGANGLAYDCATDTLYGAEQGGRMFEVDRDSGRLHGFRTVDIAYQGVGLEFHPATGTLLTATGRGNTLHRIDPETGDADRLGTIDAHTTDDLALHPPCP